MIRRVACWIAVGLFSVVSGAGLVLGTGACGGSGGGASGGPGGSGAWFIPASLVIGQPTFADGPPNQGGAAGASTLHTPRGRSAVSTTAGVPSYFCDTGNHRVLGYLAVPTANDAPADFALGQINLTNTGSGGGASQFTNPWGVHVAGGKLFLCDEGNNRVLIWNSLPTGFTPADVVLGQPNFVANAPATSATGMDTPHDVIVAGGRLIVADGGNHRVLIWNSVPTVSGTAADVIVGQSTFGGNVPNNGGLLNATGLVDPQSVWSDGTRLAVVDIGNHRVLIWNTMPAVLGAPADLVLGQPHFNSSFPFTGAGGLAGPTGIASDGTRLFVCDERCRVMVWATIPTANGAPADAVIGQSNFLNSAPNDDDQDGVVDATASARTIGLPIGLASAGGRLYVTDFANSRIEVFDLP